MGYLHRLNKHRNVYINDWHDILLDTELEEAVQNLKDNGFKLDVGAIP